MTEYDQKRIANAIDDLVEVQYDEKHQHYVTTINDMDELQGFIHLMSFAGEVLKSSPNVLQ